MPGQSLRTTGGGGRGFTLATMSICMNSSYFHGKKNQKKPTAGGLAELVECLTAEQEVTGLIPGTGPTLRVLK